jgi:hypothetical protein
MEKNQVEEKCVHLLKKAKYGEVRLAFCPGCSCFIFQRVVARSAS